MPSFEISVDFEVFCATCGAGLCNNSDTRNSRNRNTPQVSVEVCDDCIERAREEGYEKGKDETESEFDKERDDFYNQIEELENRIKELEMEK